MNYSKVTKQISETKYLSVDNAWRYRCIMRYFYERAERYQHWLNKDDVYHALTSAENVAFNEQAKGELGAEGYTLDMCQQDLESLQKWGNLVARQDTAKVQTYQQFVNKQFRFQMTEYSIEIERMAIRLENLVIEGGSLEPTLLERIREQLIKLDTSKVKDLSIHEVGIWWSQLISDFQKLNQNYQDYIRTWNSAKAEDLMKSQSFFAYKENLIGYLRHFIKELQNHGSAIAQRLSLIDRSTKVALVQAITQYEMQVPRIDQDLLIYEEVYSLVQGKLDSFCNFFIGSSGKQSEMETIQLMTNELIRRITRYAVAILESVGQFSNRREEYAHFAKLFSNIERIEDAHMLSSFVFGIQQYAHFVGDFVRETDSIQSSVWSESAFIIETQPRIRTYKERLVKTAVKSNHEQKHAMRAKILDEMAKDREAIASVLKMGTIDFSMLSKEIHVTESIRRSLLRWLAKALQEQVEGLDQRQATANRAIRLTTEYGDSYYLENPGETQRCLVQCDDGLLEMPAYRLIFEQLEDAAHG